MKTKYAQLKRMLRGLSANKASSVWRSPLAPPHPHIVSWKIPDICCNFCAPLPQHTWGFNVQMPFSPLSVPVWGSANHGQQLIQPKEKKNTVCSLATGRASQEIPSKNLIMYCLTILFACRPPCRWCNSDEHASSDGLCAAPLSPGSVTHNHWLQPVAL